MEPASLVETQEGSASSVFLFVSEYICSIPVGWDVNVYRMGLVRRYASITM